MYVTVNWRKTGIPTKETIIDTASAGWSSRKDQDALAISDSVTYEESVEFLKRLINWNHTNVLEHIVFKFNVNLSTACAAQVKTHRMASYTQKSFRITREFDTEECFITPPHITAEDLQQWIVHMDEHFRIYEYWLCKGYPTDVARFHLPQGTATNIAITMNARSLRNLFSMRLEEHAMFEFQDLCKQMVELIKQENLYFLFEDIVDDLLNRSG